MPLRPQRVETIALELARQKDLIPQMLGQPSCPERRRVTLVGERSLEG